MAKGRRQVRIQEGGGITALSKAAQHMLGARPGVWSLEDSTPDVLLLRRAEGPLADAELRLAGQITIAGSLCDVLALIGQSGWTGSLVVTNDDGTRTVEFDAGRVTGATSTVRLERFGELVYRFGLASHEQIDGARRAAAITGTSLAEALIEQDVADEESLAPIQRRHAEEVFFAVVRAKGGAFYFFDRKMIEGALPRPHPTAIELLMEGARRMDEMLSFRRHVPSERHVPEVIGVPPMAEDLQQVLGECDGKRSVADIGRRLGILEYEITQLMVRLVEAGVVAMRGPRPRGPEAITELFNAALAAMHSACDRAAVGTELREALARFVSGAPTVATLVSGAGPQDDGTFVPARVAKNLLARPTNEPVARLVKNLEEYVGFALFLATSLLPREDSVALKTEVGELLRPLDRASHSLVPASAPPRRKSAAIAAAAALRSPDVSGEFRISFSMPPGKVNSMPPSKAVGQNTVPPPSSKGSRARR